MTRVLRSSLAFVAVTLVAQAASAVSSAELYTLSSYRYGRFEARIRYAPGDGVVSSFFLWKDGSEVSGAYWNELDFEKLNADCRMQTNTLYGTPVSSSEQTHRMPADMCSAYHDYRFEWTPTYIAWFIDDAEIRRETGAAATGFAENATAGMQMRFNVWPGNANFGGNFDPAILPVQQYISWVEYSSYQNGNFKVEWREEFDGSTVPSGWATGNWASPYNLSTHNTQNVKFVNGIAVLSLTSDQAPGFNGTPPADGSAGVSSGGALGAGGTRPSGMGGTAAGGVGGVGGAITAGMGGTVMGSAAAAGHTAGAGNAGAAASGGSAVSASGGSAVSASGGSAVSASGGSAVSASGGSAVSASGGSAVSASGGNGSAATSSGAGTNSAGSAAVSEKSDDSGCGCRFTDSRQSGLAALSAALLALVTLRRRRVGTVR